MFLSCLYVLNHHAHSPSKDTQKTKQILGYFRTLCGDFPPPVIAFGLLLNGVAIRVCCVLYSFRSPSCFRTVKFFSNFHCCFAAQDVEKSALSEACFKIMSTLRIGGNSISLGADPSKTFEQSREFFAILVQNSNAGHSEFHVCFCSLTHHNTSCFRLNFIVPDSKCCL